MQSINLFLFFQFSLSYFVPEALKKTQVWNNINKIDGVKILQIIILNVKCNSSHISGIISNTAHEV